MTRTERLPVFRGAMTAIVTPFRDDGAVDLPTFEKLVAWQIASGIGGLVPCGTTGEGATLRPEEHALVIETTVHVAAGRVPVLAGCGTNDTRTTIAGAERAAKAGADGLLVVTPYYNKPNRSGMLAHFAAIARAVDLPIVAYNVPSRTGQNLGVEQTLGLSEIPGVVGVGYSLMASIAPQRWRLTVRCSRRSIPTYTREVASASPAGPRGKGTRCHSPLTSRPKNSRAREHRRS